MKRLRTLELFKYSRVKLKNQKPIAVCVLFNASMPIQWYHSNVDPTWPDGNLKAFSWANENPKLDPDPQRL
jgi:hypothetical protein